MEYKTLKDIQEKVDNANKKNEVTLETNKKNFITIQNRIDTIETIINNYDPTNTLKYFEISRKLFDNLLTI